MNTSERNEEEDYEVGDRFSLPLDNDISDYDENYNNENNNNNENYNNENYNNNENNNNEINNSLNNEEYNNENNNNISNNLNTENNNYNAAKKNTDISETTGSEIALLGDDAERYKDDDAFLEDTLMPIMRSYFPTDPTENGEKNIIMGVLKHDAIVIVKVKQLMENGTDNNEDFVEMVEEYTDDEYMDKETIEDTLELTLKYVTGIKSSIDTYVEYEFFCSSIPGYKQFVEEMLQYRVVMRLNRHKFYKELHGYLHKEVFDNYDFNTAIFDFDSEVNEFVKENKRRGRNNTKKPTANKKPNMGVPSNMGTPSNMGVPLTANNYTDLPEEPTGVINTNKINTSRVGSSIFGTPNVNTANSTANTTNPTATPTLMNQITAAVTPSTTPATSTSPANTISVANATSPANATSVATATPQPSLLNQLATATGFKAPQKGGRITPRQGHNSSRFTRKH